MGRYQSGHIYEASGAFFVRYYVSAIVDGKATRVQRSYRLCDKDDKYHSRTCKAVKQKAAEHMETVNANAAPVNDQTIAAFWERRTCPSRRRISVPRRFTATNKFGASISAFSSGRQR